MTAIGPRARRVCRLERRHRPSAPASGASVVTTVEAAGCSRDFRVMVVDNRADRRELMRHVVAATRLAAPDIADAGTAAEAAPLLDRGECAIVVDDLQLAAG